MSPNNKIVKLAADRLSEILKPKKPPINMEKGDDLLALLKIVRGIKKLPDNKRRFAEIHDIHSTLDAYMYRLLESFKAADFPGLKSEYSQLIKKMNDPEKWWSVASLMPDDLEASLREIQRQAVLLINLVLSCENLDHPKLLPRCFFNIGRLAQSDPDFDSTLKDAFGRLVKREHGRGKRGKTHSVSMAFIPIFISFLSQEELKKITNSDRLAKLFQKKREAFNKRSDEFRYSLDDKEGNEYLIIDRESDIKPHTYKMSTCFKQFKYFRALQKK